MKHYAQKDATGRIFSTLQTTEAIDHPDMIEVQPGLEVLGKRWNGAGFDAIAPTVADTAAAELEAIDRETGMGRTMRDAVLTIAAKVGADVPFLAAKEKAAAAARAKLPKG